MLKVKNKSVCILTNGNGDYIGIEADARPIIVNDISNAYKWENAAKAKNALECLPNKIKKQSSFQMMIIETQHTQINKDFLKNKSFITNYINSFSIENLPDDSLYSALNKIEIALIDYRHFVELGRFNIFEAYTCMIVFQQLLLYRRQIKDRLSLLKGWASPSELQCRNYHPRIIKELFR